MAPEAPEPGARREVSGEAPAPVESIDRAMQVLIALARAGTEGLALGTLSDRLGLHKTTLHRALAALRFREFVVQDAESGHYRLGAAALTLGDDYYAEDHLAVAVHPALVALAADVDELVHLGVLAGTSIVYLDKVEPQRPVRVFSAVGRRIPAAHTALGRALLLDRVTNQEALAPYLSGAEPDGAAHLWQVLSRSRELGFAYEREENEPGIACVALPLDRAGSSVAAVSVTAPVERMAADRMAEIAQRARTVLPPILPSGIQVREVG